MRLRLTLPAKVWEPAPVGFRPVAYNSVYPPIQKLAGGRLAIDQCVGPDGSCAIAVFDNRDDAELGQLPAHCPRSVKALFRREWRLRYLRSTDAGPIIADLERATRDWATFCKATPC